MALDRGRRESFVVRAPIQVDPAASPWSIDDLLSGIFDPSMMRIWSAAAVPLDQPIRNGSDVHRDRSVGGRPWGELLSGRVDFFRILL